MKIMINGFLLEVITMILYMLDYGVIHKQIIKQKQLNMVLVDSMFQMNININKYKLELVLTMKIGIGLYIIIVMAGHLNTNNFNKNRQIIIYNINK